jgi:hypothetical protein
LCRQQLPDAAYSVPKEIIKVNSKGKEFSVANPAYKKREALHDFMKNTLKATDDDILEFENSLLASRYQLDLNSLTLDNQFLKPLIREAKDVLGIKGLSKQEEKIARDVLSSATELSDTFTSQLGKYMNREYKIFKKEKNIFKKIFSGDDFKPTQEIIQKSERVFRTAIAQAYKNSDTTRAKATEIVELRASQRQKQPMVGRGDPLMNRERNISKQKAIEEQIDRMAKDYYDNVAPQKATDAVEAIITTRGKSLFETPAGPISGFKKFIKDEASLELDEGIFKERTLRNPVIRQLLGEIEDPFYNIANTNSKQAQIMAQLQTHNKLFQDTVRTGEGGAAKSNMFFDSSA